jgi:3-oxoadipate enol-lactonase
MSNSEPLLYYRRDGQGEALLLLNGIAMSISSWEPVVALLKSRFTIIRCDFRGQLLTPGPAPSELDSHVKDVEELLDSLIPGPLHVAGTSFGGLVGMRLAARRPDIQSLTVLASADYFDDAMSMEVKRWRNAARQAAKSGDHGHLLDVMATSVYSKEYRKKNCALLANRRDQMQHISPNWFHDLDRLMASTEGIDLTSELRKIQCPSLIAAAEKDGFIPLDRARALAEAIPRSEFQVISGAGHAVVMENPEAVAARILHTTKIR